jgi:DNA-binding transcriptional ArsR family regulator
MLEDQVFHALSDPHRRLLLERLLRRNGLALGELADDLGISRFAVMKHLRVLEAANLLLSEKVGRMRLHYLNVVPLRQVERQWMRQFTDSDVRPKQRTDTA